MKARRTKGKTVFVNGVFDIVHPGHIQLLKFARTQGDKLVVGINSDRVVKLLKGPSRPINDEKKRKRFLESLDWIDEVVIFDDIKTGPTVRKIGADIVVRGESGRSDEETRKIDGLPKRIEIARFNKVMNFSTTNNIISDILRKAKDRHILLVGDAILDVYIYGTAVGQALGTTVPRIEERKVEISFGGNGLIAKNMLELGGRVTFVSVVGADEEAKHYERLKHPKLKKQLIVDKSRPTIVKKRIFADGARLLHLNRADHRQIGADIERKVIAAMRSAAGKADAIVIMDPQHGLLTKAVIKEAISLSRKHATPLYVDTQISHSKSNHYLYKGGGTMFLNENEAIAVYPKWDTKKAEQSLQEIKRKLNLHNVVVKLGPEGSVALVGGTFIKTPAAKVVAVDPVGAGDAFLSAFALGDERHPRETLFIANAWAALSTTIPGTTPPKGQALVDLLASL